jgi:hypothetical protein
MPAFAASSAVPTVLEWNEQQSAVRRLEANLRRVGESGVFALHPLAETNTAIIEATRPTEELLHRANRAMLGISALQSESVALGIDWDSFTRIELVELVRLCSVAAQLNPRACEFLNPQSPGFASLVVEAKDQASLRAAAADTTEKAAGWRNPLNLNDAITGLSVARSKESSVFKVFSGDWRSLKETVAQRYDFAAHAVRPSVQSVLELLIARYEAEKALEQHEIAVEHRFGQRDLAQVLINLQGIHRLGTRSICELRDRVARGDLDGTLMVGTPKTEPGKEELGRVQPYAIEADESLTALFAGRQERELSYLVGRAERLQGASGQINELLTDLRAIAKTPSVDLAIRTVAVGADHLELFVMHNTIRKYEDENTDVERFDGQDLAQRLMELEADMRALLHENALAVRSRVCTNFKQRVAISATASPQLPAEQKALKKRYSTGRKELEHEFAKTMRYRSIRELASGNPGEVLFDLRPIWLMSPLSVSDTLPLDSSIFDVVIFDEASQIPLEEAVPALYRSHQTIVVGDQMQLPPTQFFTTRSNEDDEVDSLSEDGDRVGFVLDSDSFLAQSAASLPSTMLAWHYRSRSEELIGFSNAAFYGGTLSTVPDLHRAPAQLSPIIVGRQNTNAAVALEPLLSEQPTSEKPSDQQLSKQRISIASQGEQITSEQPTGEQLSDTRMAEQPSVEDVGENGVEALLSRNVSFHHLPQGVYESRRNTSEATYVAELVRSLLAKDTGLTVGVAAFSEAQQGEIDEALQRVAAKDPSFAAKLEAEETREDDDQFVGLFVKNLENVQGDERDVIIMSVCYAPGPTGRMVMNFGPINQRGGEKRLNVIFSRARRHMAIVSSIRGSQITNEHNDGANALRRFLDYAEALSVGDTNRASAVLQLVNPLQRRSLHNIETSPVAEGLAQALRTLGFVVDVNHGRSRFRCDLAVRHQPDDDHYLAVLIDSRDRATLGSIDERSIVHPMILASFGWRVVHVLTKDWFSQPHSVISAIVTAMAR